MPGLLLDEHISPSVCVIVRRERPGLLVESVLEWRVGRWRGKDDEQLLTTVAAAGLTLVTYDQRTIRPLIVRWAESAIPCRSDLCRRSHNTAS